MFLAESTHPLHLGHQHLHGGSRKQGDSTEGSWPSEPMSKAPPSAQLNLLHRD